MIARISLIPLFVKSHNWIYDSLQFLDLSVGIKNAPWDCYHINTMKDFPSKFSPSLNYDLNQTNNSSQTIADKFFKTLDTVGSYRRFGKLMSQL
jgi:hypothetical protein